MYKMMVEIKLPFKFDSCCQLSHRLCSIPYVIFPVSVNGHHMSHRFLWAQLANTLLNLYTLSMPSDLQCTSMWESGRGALLATEVFTADRKSSMVEVSLGTPKSGQEVNWNCLTKRVWCFCEEFIQRTWFHCIK